MGLYPSNPNLAKPEPKLSIAKNAKSAKVFLNKRQEFYRKARKERKEKLFMQFFANFAFFAVEILVLAWPG